ncbi:methyltransferase [Chaetomidium leptoderma]|uniref:Methyltransferase n=1 Tax=Chaetomidium leptoderma TaxID=669021 RepID=A0AAN6ZU39_9PEZI|nr:methyltransferase [Chaetomidium leptoderma]
MVIQAEAGDWDTFAETYKRITESTNTKPVGAILDRLNALRPFRDAFGVLDNGCGPGTIMARLIDKYGASLPRSCSLICTDYAPGMINQVVEAREKQEPGSIWARVDARVLDALDLNGIGDNSLTHVAAGLLYNLTTDPHKCLSECRRVLQPNGVLAASAWEGNEWLEMMQVLPIIKPELQSAVKAKWTSVSAMKADLEQAGFREVDVEPVPVQVPFQSHDLFVDTLLTYQPRMVSLLRDFSEQQKATLRKLLIEEMKVYCPSEPGALNGVVLVATGCK